MGYDKATYWNMLLDKALDESGVCWPQWPISYNKHLHRQQKNIFVEILEKHNILFKEASVVELGPGMGFWTNFFYHIGIRNYLGIDISKNSVNTLKMRFPDFCFENSDFSEYEIDKSSIGTFDIACSILVFLHITNNRDFDLCVKKISEMLKIGGQFIVLDAVSRNPLKGKHKSMQDGVDFDDKYHNKVRVLDEYIKIYESYGFELVEIRPAFNISQNGFDFSSKLGYQINNFYFKKILYPLLVHSTERMGEIIGRVIVGLDDIFFSKAGFSSKWMVFKKVR